MVKKTYSFSKLVEDWQRDYNDLKVELAQVKADRDRLKDALGTLFVKAASGMSNDDITAFIISVFENDPNKNKEWSTFDYINKGK